MLFKELKENLSLFFPQDRNEPDASYQFFIKEALGPFKNRPGDLTGIWEAIKEYDGNTRRPKFGFFIGIAVGTKAAGGEGFVYYLCKCGEKLNSNSAGGCVNCRKPGAKTIMVKEPIPVTRCQSSCFDCSIYSDKQIGPTCDDFGTPAYEKCKIKNDCNCQACCRFEWKRVYHPDALRADYPAILQTLPKPLSAAGLAFHEGRADFLDIQKMLVRAK